MKESTWFTGKCDTCAVPMVPTEQNLYRCPNCGLLSLNLPIREALYGKEYIEKYRGYRETLLGKRINHHRWEMVKRWANGHDTLLDYGAGAGNFIEWPERPEGIAVYGFDVNPHSDYTTCKMPVDPQVLTMFDVIEHLPSPVDVIKTIDPKILIVLTPNAGAIDVGMIRGWKHFRPGEHLHYFDVPSLTHLYETLGFKVKSWDFKEGQMRNPEAPFDLVTMVGVRE